jgi:Cu(I)/Ag(I) efflux system protein CusF
VFRIWPFDRQGERISILGTGLKTCIGPRRNYTAHSMKLPHLLLLLTLAAQAAQAQTSLAPAKAAAAASARQMPLARGEVLEVDEAEKRVLVKHGRIRSLGMDPMTMEFLVPDAELLGSLKPGDQIRFAAVYKDSDYLITHVELVKRRAAQRSKSP